ncbi:hypothetical protein YB2330_003426 [Saitoella coloradoensis]
MANLTFDDILKTLLSRSPPPPLCHPPHPYSLSLRTSISALQLDPRVEIGLHILNDDLYSAHFLCRHMQGELTGDWWHGILHRIEGDYENARCWYDDIKHPMLREVHVDPKGFVDGIESVKAHPNSPMPAGKELKRYEELRKKSLEEVKTVLQWAVKRYGKEGSVQDVRGVLEAPGGVGGGDGCVRVWIDVRAIWNDSDSFDKALSLVPETLHKDIGAYHFPQDRKHALASALLQHYFVAAQYHIPISQVKITRDEGRRPSIDLKASGLDAEEMKAVDYNISHQGGYVALVGDTKGGRRVGVDIVVSSFPPGFKEMPKDDSWLDDFKDVFSQDEFNNIKSVKDAKERLKIFYWHWALKESYVKATGTGLVTNLPAIDFVNVSAGTAAKVQVHGRLEPWSFELEEIDQDVWIATCTPRADTPWTNTAGTKGKWRKVSWEDVVRGGVYSAREDLKEQSKGMTLGGEGWRKF